MSQIIRAYKGYELNNGRTGCIDINECETQLGCQGIQNKSKSFMVISIRFDKPQSRLYVQTTFSIIAKIPLEVIDVFQIIYR